MSPPFPRLLLSIAFLLGLPAAGFANGPGLGNLTYQPAEQWNLISSFKDTNGAPRGHGFVVMHRGWLAVIFSNDGGGGNGTGGFSFYNVSNPRSPALTFTTSGNAAYGPGPNYVGDMREPHGFSMSGDTLCMTSNNTQGLGAGLQFWDWSQIDPPNPQPRKLGEISLPGLTGGDYAPTAWWVCWQGGRYAYVAGTSAGLYIVDASDPANPVLVNRGAGKPNPIPTSQLGGFRISSIFAVGNLLVAAASDNNGFATYDISDPKNPVLLQTVNSATGYSMMVNGNRVLGANNPAKVWDISNPASIQFVGSGPQYSTASKGGYGTFQDGFFHYGSSTQYVKLDIRTTPFTVAGTAAPTGFSNPDWDFATALGNITFMGNDHSGSAIVVHQLAPDTNPPLVNMAVPADGKTSQALTSRVGLTFTDQIDTGSITAANFIVRPLGGAALPGRYSNQTGIVNFWPDALLQPNTTYEVILPAGGLRDVMGNAIAAQYRSVFSTGATLNENVQLTAVSPGPRETSGSVTFTASGTTSSGSLQYMWDFGDGSGPTAFSSSPSISHTYAAPGHYFVWVMATNGSSSSTAVFVQTVHNPLTPTQPTRSTSILHEPSLDRVWSVNPDNDTVAMLNAGTLAKIAEPLVGRNPRTLAVAPNGRVWVVNQDDATISILDKTSGALVSTVALPRASRPYGVAFSPSGAAAWVSLEATGKLLRLDSVTGATTGSLDVGPTPRGLAISGDSARILVTRFISPDTRGEVVEVNANALTVTRTFPLGLDPGPDTEASGRGLPNYLSAIAITPDGRRAWAPSKKDNIQRGPMRDGLELTFESMVRTIVSQLDLVANTEDLPRRLDLNDRDGADAVCFTKLGDYVVVATQGTNTVEIIDAYSNELAASLLTQGRAPQGVALSADGTRLFTQNFMSRSVSAFDLSALVSATGTQAPFLGETGTVASEKLAPQVLAGKRLFYNAADPRMNRDSYISCASCHVDGGHDGRTWDFTGRGEGVRNTISLRGGGGGGRVHWSANFDEVQDFEHDIREAFSGDGFIPDAAYQSGTRNLPLGDPKAGLSPDLDALAAYLASLDQVDPSPHRAADGSLTPEAFAGKAVFNQLNCVSCHSGPAFSDSPSNLLHNVGTVKPSSGMRNDGPLPGIDTPTLRGLWQSAPYLHDGSAATLTDVLTTANPSGAHGPTNSLTSAQRAQLVAYLQQIDGSETAPLSPPLVQLSSPVDRGVYAAGSTVEVSAEVSSALGAVTRVEFYRDEQLLAQDTTAPYLMTWSNISAGAYRFSARAFFANGVITTTDFAGITVTNGGTPAGIQINFQPATSAVPSGYKADTGAVYGTRGDGQTYGWSTDLTGRTRLRTHADPRYATLSHFYTDTNGPNNTWEIALPNGLYDLFIVCGDAGFTNQVNNLSVEGIAVNDPNGQSASNNFDEFTLTGVSVTDGKLTITGGTNAVNPKICFLHITAPRPVISITAPVASAGEEIATPGMFRIARTGSTAAALTVQVALSGSATNGLDYAAVATTQTIPAGQAFLDVPVAPLADTLAEGAETARMTLLSDTAYSPGASTTATVTIADSAIDAWKVATFTAAERNDPTISGDLADPDGDGIANILEFALGLAARTPGALPLNPQIVGDRLELSLIRAAEAAHVAIIFEVSGNLAVWSDKPADVTTTSITNGDGSATLTGRDLTPVSASSHRFIRVRAARK